MATVYEATDLRLDRQVALKVVPHSLAEDDEFAQRFVREARSAARLSHPNVVGVYDQGADDGLLYLAMEYVDGRATLRDLIRTEAPFTPARALSLFEPVLEAIAAAHESGIIHRDIKPENVLINPRGQLKVTDFGLARAVTASTAATATGGLLMGTVSYLPPELVVDGRADARSDVYSLGVLLFELLTGVKPHDGDSPIQIAYRHVHEDVPAPSTLEPGIPAYVDALVARATARQRDLRPADAHVLLQQVRRVKAALDAGVRDDPELTDDLTPTVAIASGRARVAAAQSDERPGLGTSDPDEVFDQEALAWPDRTLVVGSPTLSGSAATAAGLAARGGAALPGAAGLAAGSETVGAVTTATRTIGGSVPDGRHDNSSASTGWSEQTAPGGGGGGAARGGGSGGRGDGGSPYGPTITRRPRRRHTGLIVFLVVLLLATGAALAGWWFGVARFETTPNVVHLSQAVASHRLQQDGLTLQVTATAYSETVPDGRLISTSPAPGQRISKGAVVHAVISKGPERHAVPKLAGMTESKAIQTLRANRLRVGKVTRPWRESVPKGTLIAFSPRAGTLLHRDGVVNLVISNGPQPIPVVDFVHKSGNTAKAALTKAGFVVDSRSAYSDTVALGNVISQVPRSGTGHRGDHIHVVVSKGPHLVEVPDVVHAGIDSAKQTLEAAGFRVHVTKYQPYFGLGFVVAESPSDGMAPYHSVVTIAIV